MTKTQNDIRPTAPGEYVRRDILGEFRLTQKELAERLGVSRRTVNQLVRGKRGISADMALRLGKLTGTTPRFWLNLQNAVDVWVVEHAEDEAGKSLDAIAPILD